MLYVVRALGGRFAEGYVASNSREQAANRVFLAAARIVKASPLLRDAKVTADRITFRSTGATITAIASNYFNRSRLKPHNLRRGRTLTSPRSSTIASSTNWCHRRRACRAGGLSTTYAGFTGESVLLEPLYRRGLTGRQIAPDLYAAPGLLMYWTHSFIRAVSKPS